MSTDRFRVGRKWDGDKPLVIGIVTEFGIAEEIIIQPGEEITGRAAEFIAEAAADPKGPLKVPYPDSGYDPERVLAAAAAEKAEGEAEAKEEVNEKNTKVMQIHTHKIEPGAECCKKRPCMPFGQAIDKGWVHFFQNPKVTPGFGKLAFALGDLEMGYASVLNACPFCLVRFDAIHDDYMSYRPDRKVVAIKENGEAIIL